LNATTARPAPRVDKLLHQRVAMRDGIHLDTNVFHLSRPGRFPAILIRTPYNKGPDLSPSYAIFVEHGYAIVVQDVRGRYASEGTFDPLDQEGPDGYDTINWIARQPWSDGNVGMVGASYPGIAQWKVAVLGNPHLKTIFPTVSGDDDYLDRFYSRGGATKLGHRLLWFSENFRLPGFPRPKFADYVNHVPIRTADLAATGRTIAAYQKALNHPTYDEFWKHLSVREHISRVRVPVFAVGGWYDNYVESDLDAFAELERVPGHAEHQVLIGPWGHSVLTKLPNADFGPDASVPLRAYQLAWFDRWLKNSANALRTASPASNARVASLESAPVHIFVMGINRWRDEPTWPPPETRYTSLYLDSKGHANTASGDGELHWTPRRTEVSDQYRYDPKDPVPTVGGAVCCNPNVFPWGPLDQTRVEKRPDVLVYTTTLLKHEVEATGEVKVVLYASTSAPDTDFTAKLVDVFPDGEPRNVCDGILRLRYRDGLNRSEPARPGEVYAITIPVGVTSNVFLPGHRIRLEISSSNFPRFDRNPNTGGPIASETTLKTARQTVYHGAQYSSRIILPIIRETQHMARVKLN
jgi:putative CocE/NonD family hydrolase